MERAAVSTDSQADMDWHSLPVRVYYEDTDAQGVVYFANYLRFAERGRAEWLRARGVEQDALMRDRNLCFSMVSTQVSFRRPARFNDELTVLTRVSKVSGARIYFDQAVYLAADIDNDSKRALCEAQCVVACVSADEFKPRRVPAELLTS
jgi:acyl-CoA thioester hydrolase